VPSLSIVIPAYNEEPNIAEAIRTVSKVAHDLHLEHEILPVNDGSRDRTGDVIREVSRVVPHVQLIEHHPNRGYGGALRAGFDVAAKDVIAFIAADNQYDFAEVESMLDKLAPDVVLVSGWRANDEDNFMRRLNRFGWNMLIRLLFGYLLKDIDCGFKIFRREILQRVHLESSGAMIDTELLAQLRARGYKVDEVPVRHLPRTAGSPTGANPHVVLRAFRDLIRFRLRLSRELRGERRVKP
jgi:glycosyltransferase involved in cell wall biosynthesis